MPSEKTQETIDKVKAGLKYGGAAIGGLAAGPEGAAAGFGIGETVGDIGEFIYDFFEPGYDAYTGIPAVKEVETPKMKRLRIANNHVTNKQPTITDLHINNIEPLIPLQPLNPVFQHLTPKDVKTEVYFTINRNTIVPAIQNINPNPGFGTNGFGNGVSLAYKQMATLPDLSDLKISRKSRK